MRGFSYLGDALREGLRAVVGVAVLAIRVLVRAVPRRREVWLFGSWYGTRFAGSPRALFLYCLRHRPDLSVAWITRRRSLVQELRRLGLPVYHRFSLRGLWLSVRAGVYLFDCRSSDVNYVTSAGAVNVNLWHGIPLKRIEHDIADPSHPFQRSHIGSWWMRALQRLSHPTNGERYDLLCAASPFVARRLAQAFRIPVSRVLVAEAPCNDALVAGPEAYEPLREAEAALVGQLHQSRQAGRRLIAYLPTFRDRSPETPEVALDLTALEAMLGRYDAILWCKLHGEDRRRFAGATGAERVRVLPTDTDASLLLHFMDVLITDYSSVYFDFLLLDRPIVFFAYDLAEYQRSSRSLYDPYERVTPGPIVRTTTALMEALEEVLSAYEDGSGKYAKARQELCARVHGPLPTGTRASAAAYATIAQTLAAE